MKYMLNTLGCLLILVLFSSCVPLSINPLSSYKKAQCDKRLIGTWFCNSPDDKSEIWVHFIEAKNSMTDIVFITTEEKKGASVATYKMHPTKVGRNNYMNLKPYLPNEHSTSKAVRDNFSKDYMFAKYEVSKDTLKVWLLSNKIGDSIKKGMLKGSVAKRKLPDNVVITDTSEKILTFLQKANHGKIFTLLFSLQKVQSQK